MEYTIRVIFSITAWIFFCLAAGNTSKAQLVTASPENLDTQHGIVNNTIEAQAMAFPAHRGDTIELTETDIARLPAFNGSHATIFGIALGMSRTQVKEKISKFPYLRLEEDPFTPKRFYLNDVSSDSGKVTIGYLKWMNYDSGLYQVILYPPVSKYLRGLTCSIVSSSCIDPESEIYKTFLGAPAGKDVTLDMPAISAKNTMLYYPKLNLVIEESISGTKTEYHIVLTHKW
jgi:hypothetical protein